MNKFVVIDHNTGDAMEYFRSEALAVRYARDRAKEGHGPSTYLIACVLIQVAAEMTVTQHAVGEE